MNIQDLYAKRATAWEAAKQFINTHTMENGCLSSEDAAQFARMEEELANYSNEINRRNRMAELEAEMAQPTTSPILNTPDVKDTTGRGKEYSNALLNAVRHKFRNDISGLNTQTDSEGGYLIPEEWDSRIHDVLEEENCMRRLATTITTRSERKFNLAGDNPAAAWIDEGEQITFTTATFGQMTIGAHKLGIAIKVTEELLQDNQFNLQGYILDKFARALANAEEDAFLNGKAEVGQSGRPTGLLHTTLGGIYSTPISMNASSVPALKSDDVMDLVYALKRPYRKNASFIMNDAIMPHVRKLKDSTGQYLWQPSYQAGEPDRILGYSVNTSAFAPTIPSAQPTAAEGDKPIMTFGDYKYYYIADRGTRSLAILHELYAETGMVGYIMKERLDGILINREAVQVMYAKAAEAVGG